MTQHSDRDSGRHDNDHDGNEDNGDRDRREHGDDDKHHGSGERDRRDHGDGDDHHGSGHHARDHSPPQVTLNGIAETLAAIPHLLGFHPAESVVLLSGTECGTPLGRTLRGDLPPDHLVDTLARDMTVSLADDDVSSALVVVIGGVRGDGSPGGRAAEGARTGIAEGTAADGQPPWRELVAALRRELAAFGVTDVAAFWVPELAAGAEYRCYDDGGTGAMPDPASSVLAAELASRGYVTYGSRAELAALLAPDSEPRVARRAELIETRRAAGTGAWPLACRVAAVRDGLNAARRGPLALTDTQLATLAIALGDVRVRDACLATALPADSGQAVAAAALWQALTRALPAPERAEPACLGGYAAYMGGDGALAAIAFSAALDADPDHVLAGLLDRALRHGIPPDRLHPLATHDTVGLCPDSGAAAARRAC